MNTISKDKALASIKKAYIFYENNRRILPYRRDIHDNLYGDIHIVYVNRFCGKDDFYVKKIIPIPNASYGDEVEDDDFYHDSSILRKVYLSSHYRTSRACEQEVFNAEGIDPLDIMPETFSPDFILADDNRIFISGHYEWEYKEYTPHDPEYIIYLNAAKTIIADILVKSPPWITDSRLKDKVPY